MCSSEMGCKVAGWTHRGGWRFGGHGRRLLQLLEVVRKACQRVGGAGWRIRWGPLQSHVIPQVTSSRSPQIHFQINEFPGLVYKINFTIVAHQAGPNTCTSFAALVCTLQLPRECGHVPECR